MYNLEDWCESNECFYPTEQSACLTKAGHKRRKC